MQTIKLDLQQQSILTPLKAKQNDRYSRFFKVVLLDGSTAFSIHPGATLTVRYISPSGSGWYDTITEIDNTTKHSAFAISGNEVTVELAEATLTKPGNGMLCLQIYTATGYRIGTWNIPLEIEADPLADSTIAASDYYNVLTAQVAQTLQYKNDAASSAQAAAASAALAQQLSLQNKGWFATDTALKAAFPTGQNGWWAIVGAGDNIWTWDADTNAWVNTHTQTDFSNYYTKSQADAAFLGKTETASNSNMLGGQLAAYYAKQADINALKENVQLFSGNVASGAIQLTDSWRNYRAILVCCQYDNSINNGVYTGFFPRDLLAIMGTSGRIIVEGYNTYRLAMNVTSDTVLTVPTAAVDGHSSCFKIYGIR